MAGKLFLKQYVFGGIILILSLFLLLTGNASKGSAVTGTGIRILLAGLLILIFFDLMHALMDPGKTSYLSMLMERPLFNPKGNSGALRMIYPLHPRFVALYFDHDDESPYGSRVFSIQAVRYEFGYYSDRLFLPLKSSDDGVRGKLLTSEEALKHLKSYIKDFPVIVHDKDFANIWMREQANSLLLSDAIDTTEIARMIYPKLDAFGIEEINDWLGFEVDESDPVYGAKITTSVYLDYLRLHNFQTTLEPRQFNRMSEVHSVFPGEAKLQFAKVQETPVAGEWKTLPETVTAALAKEDEQFLPGHRYIGPFTPIDDEGFDIPERGHVVAREDK